MADSVHRVTASDISPMMIEVVNRKTAQQELLIVTFTTGQISDESLETGTSDTVIAFDLLHLLRDVPATIRNVNRLLKPG